MEETVFLDPSELSIILLLAPQVHQHSSNLAPKRRPNAKQKLKHNVNGGTLRLVKATWPRSISARIRWMERPVGQ